jgi:hypothetical protein
MFVVDKNNMKMRVLVILKDEMVEVLTTLSSPRNHIIELDIAKALAALKPAHLCRELGFNRVILEGKALQVMQALTKDGRS